MPIISDPAARLARAQEKQTLLLRFLRDEIYTTPSVVAELLQIDARAARRTVATLERAGYVKRHALNLIPDTPPARIIGITAVGQSNAFDPAAGEKVITRWFERDRFSLVYLKHTLDVQRLRIAAARAGVEKWRNGDRLEAVQKGVKKPDALCIDLSGKRTAIECERSVKSPKAYSDVLGAHLQAIKQGKWRRVIWSCPDAQTREKVRALLLGVKLVRVASVPTQIEPAQHHALLAFCTHDEFPSLL